MKTDEKGFSLLEVMVASFLLIVGLLLVVSSTGVLREKMAATRCLSRLRQMGGAILASCADRNGEMLPPILEDPENPSNNLSASFWHLVLRRQGYFGPPPDESTNALRMLANKSGNHFCPLLPSAGGNEESYGMRRWRSPGQDDSRRYKPIRQIETPSRFFIMTDSYKPEKKTQGYYTVPGSTAYRIYLAHQGAANTLFLDGHVAPLKQNELEALAAEQTQYYNKLPFSFWPESQPSE